MKKYLFLLLSFLVVSQHVLAQSKDLRFVSADEVEEGDGAAVRRLIPQKKLKHFDPYVLFDDFTIAPTAGFPDHYHSGFEVVTYLIAGKLQHKDSKGNTVVLSAGDVQCFSTGSGVVHSEMPQGNEAVRGFQIWINLPKEDKQMEAQHEYVRAESIQETNITEQVRLKTIVGQGATVRTKAELLIQELNIMAGARYKAVLPVGYQGWLYVYAGKATIEGKSCSLGDAVLFERQDLEIQAEENTLLLLVSGLPLGEPIHRKGSIVK